MIIQESLKKDTRADHERLEESMFVRSIMSGTLSLVEYKQILATNYLIHEAYENLLFDALPGPMSDEIQSSGRYKSASLQMDLEEVGMTDLTGMRFINDRDNIGYQDIPFVLGALYVLEGATLGGSVILKRLVTNIHINDIGLRFHYYKVYGDELGAKWKSFCALLNQQPDDEYPSILAGARSMFNIMEDVMSRAVIIGMED